MATETVIPCAGGAAAGGEQQYSLRWNDFHAALVSSFRHLRDEEDFVDVTLACAGATFTAHKVVLSACSPYFRKLLKANPCQHPIVILRDVQDKDMENLLRFMYQGEVHIGQEQLKEFLRAAQLLQVRGLTDVPAPAPLSTIDQKASPSACSWTESVSGASRESRRTRRPDDGAEHTPPPKRARTEQLLAAQRTSPERLGTNGCDPSVNQNHYNSNNMLDGDDSSSDGGPSDTEGETRAKQEPIDYDDPTFMANTNGAMPHNFPGLLNLQGFPGLAGPSGISDNYGGCRRTQDLLRVRATDPRPCPKCGKIYRSAHTLRTHLEDKHTVCPGYRCVLCGTVAKSRNSLHSHMSRQHRGISTKDLPVLQMPTRFDPELASQLLAKAGFEVSPEQLRARASPTGPRRSDIKLDLKSAASENSSICEDNDNDDLSQSKYRDSLALSPPHINNLANTTITKVPAVRAVPARNLENMPHDLGGLKHDTYPPVFSTMTDSTLIDTYMKYIGCSNMFDGINAKIALNALRNSYEPLPQIKLPPPTTLADHRLLKMQRQCKPHISRDADEPLDLGKERQRAASPAELDDQPAHEKDAGKDYHSKEYTEEKNRLTSEHDQNSGHDEGEYSEDEQKNSS